MNARAVIGVLVAFCGLWPCQAGGCQLPAPGKCSSDNSADNSDLVCGIQAASCKFSNTSGLCAYRQGCADSAMSNWTLGGGTIRAYQSTLGDCSESTYYYSVLESPRLNISQASCLTVRYHRTLPAALDVFLELDAGEVVTLLNRSDNAGNNVSDVFTTNVNPGIGKIIFRAYGGGGGSGSYVVIHKVTMKTGKCSGSASPSPSLSPSPSSLSSSSPSSSSSSSSVHTSATRPAQTSSTVASSQSDTPRHSTDPFIGGGADDQDGGNSNPAVIAGAVAAVVAVIVIIIVVVIVLIRRRRISKSGDQNESPTRRQDEENDVAAPKAEANNNHDYSEILSSHFLPPVPADDGGYFELGKASPCPSDPGIDPYEPLPDAGPRQCPEDDHYNHLTPGGLPGRADPPENANGDYHHIHAPRSTPAAKTSSGYTQAQKPSGQPGKRYSYTKMNKKDKKMAVEDAPGEGSAYSNAYSNVPANVQKPAIAPKPPGKAEGHTAKADTHNAGSANETSDGDTYNHLQSPPTAKHDAGSSHGELDPASDTYNRINMTSHPEQQGKSPRTDVEDDYNTLKFDDPAHTSGAAIGQYDHVRNNPDDEYSQAGGEKRRVVIDSSYDHVKLADTVDP